MRVLSGFTHVLKTCPVQRGARADQKRTSPILGEPAHKLPDLVRTATTLFKQRTADMRNHGALSTRHKQSILNRGRHRQHQRRRTKDAFYSLAPPKFDPLLLLCD